MSDRSPPPRARREAFVLVLDGAASLLLVTFVLLMAFFYQFTQYPPSHELYHLAQVSRFVASTGVAGVAALSLFAYAGVVKIRFERDLADPLLFAWLFAQVGLSLAVSGLGRAGSVFDSMSFLVVANALAEELLFSLLAGGIALSLVKSTAGRILAGLGVSALFAAYHLTVYGGDGLALAFVFLLRLFYFALLWKRQRLSSPMLLHLINNLIGVLV